MATSRDFLDVGFDRIPTPIGELLLAATPRGLVRVAFASEGIEAVLEDLAGRIGPRILRHPDLLAPAGRAIAAYLRGENRSLDLPLDLSLSRGFRKEVLDELRRIGYGSTRSYAEVAAATGRPRAVRAVGSACAANPLPIVIPCHRVLRSDGSLGGYLGGREVKRALLAMEAG